MSPTKDKIVTVALIGGALWLFSKAGSLLNIVGNAESFRASGSSSKLMTEKAAIHALTTAKGKFMTVTFLKKDGSTRRMRCRTGVKRYVKGVGSPLGTPSNRLQKYKLITVYDLDKAGYRSIPVDRVLSVKAAGKTFSSKNPKGKQMSAEEYNSYNAEWEAIFDVYGRRGYFADLPDKLTEERTEDEILDMIMDESDHPEWEEVDEMIPQGIEKHDAESFEANIFTDMLPTMVSKCDLCPWHGDAEDFNYHIAYACPGTISHRAMLIKAYESNFGAESEETDCAVCVKPFYTSMDGSRCLGCDEMFCDDHYDIDEEMCISCCESLEAESPRVGYQTPPKQCSVCGDLAVHVLKNGEIVLCDKHYQQKFGRYSAETSEACEYCGEAGGELVEMREEHISGPIVKVCEHCYDIARLGAESDTLTDYSDYGSLWNDTHAYLISIGKSKAKADELMERYETFVESGYENGESPHTIGISITENERLDLEAPYVGAGALMDIGKDTGLGSFSPSELATSSAIHGDFDQASLNYSGKQNLEVRAESDRDEDEEDYEQYLRLQGLCECTACGDIGPLATGTTDKQGLYRCIACVTADQPSISEEEIVEDMDYLRGIH